MVLPVLLSGARCGQTERDWLRYAPPNSHFVVAEHSFDAPRFNAACPSGAFGVARPFGSRRTLFSGSNPRSIFTKKGPQAGAFFSEWRTERDSNPR